MRKEDSLLLSKKISELIRTSGCETPFDVLDMLTTTLACHVLASAESKSSAIKILDCIVIALYKVADTIPDEVLQYDI